MEAEKLCFGRGASPESVMRSAQFNFINMYAALEGRSEHPFFAPFVQLCCELLAVAEGGKHLTEK